jgi:hypothetical protein
LVSDNGCKTKHKYKQTHNGKDQWLRALKS